MKRYPISFHDWHGWAVRRDACFWVPPRQISDHLGLSWRRQWTKIEAMFPAKGMPQMGLPFSPERSQYRRRIEVRTDGGPQDVMMLSLGALGAWLLSIKEGKLTEEKAALLALMKLEMMAALERQLTEMFGLPGLLEVDELVHLPMPGWVLDWQMPDTLWDLRETLLDDQEQINAVRLARLGLPATRVAAALQRSVYWARNQRRYHVRIGLVPPTKREQQRLESMLERLDRPQSDLFSALDGGNHG